MTIRELFDFIVDSTITDDAVDSYLEEVQQKILARGDTITAEEQIADSVFVQSYIPKTLEQVKDAEEDAFRLTSGNDTGDMYYKTITGLNHMTQTSALQEAATTRADLGVDETDSGSGSDDDDEGEDDDSCSETEEKRPSGTGKLAPEDRKAARKENKKKVKEEKREARKTKIPKAVKKKKKKLSKAHKTR
ncbi:unnamed protein product [Amaranthus hypochondriacus]